MKSFIYFITFLLCAPIFSPKIFAQYQIGDYYVNGNTKGIVFFVNDDESTLYLLKTEMSGRYEDYGIGDAQIPWADKEFIIDNANASEPYNVWDIPTPRIARLINMNHRIVRERAIQLGYKGLPFEAFCEGRISSDGAQRLIPVFIPKSLDGDIFTNESESALIEYGCGVLLYGIVNYRTGQMQKLN